MPRPVRLVLAALTAAALAPSAIAAPVDSQTARGLLFAERGRTVQIADVDFLGPAERKAVEQYAQTMPFYSALAVSPGDPANTGSALAAQNYHSPGAAQAAALAGCNARRKSGGPCVIVATVLPRGWQPRALSLSLEATAALRGDYRRLQAPKALAISPSTGALAFDRGDGGRALSACNARVAEQKARPDCVIAVEDR